MPDTIEVRFRDCRCPGSPHPDGDVAYLRPYLDYSGGAEALASVTITDGETSRLRDVNEWPEHIGPVFIRRGVVDWNVVDEDGEPVPLHPALEELRWEDAYELADRADDLYGGQVLAPLVKRMSMSSKAGRTNGSTRQPRKSSPARRTQSGSSS